MSKLQSAATDIEVELRGTATHMEKSNITLMRQKRSGYGGHGALGAPVMMFGTIGFQECPGAVVLEVTRQ